MKKPAAIITFKVKMSAPLAAYTKGKDVVKLKLPNDFALGCKLFMTEYIGGYTGRADVATIIGYEDGLTVLQRRFCWHLGKFNDDLKHLSLSICEVDPIPFFTAKNIPDGQA